MDYLDLHTHHANEELGITSIESLSITDDEFQGVSKTKLISVGLHPWYASVDKLDLQMHNLSLIAAQKNVKLIGECGLDKLKGEAIENQVTILEAQINLAEKLQKPLILHCVKAFDELIAIKQRLAVKVPMILHGFNKNEELGRQLLAKGFLLSFGSSVLQENFKNAKLINGMDNFFLETDKSTNSIEEIYQVVAEIRKCSINDLKARIFANWEKLILNP
ncbi:hydrolase TatD [Pedobacter changchengzhani]|uniref:Hydrolase TatD n=1 Tax=Pedobacter changchengzhani TaxID=2529274 RepID=A0A4R5MN90_9SPHI|nr:TatD family hydrolase [Pedobacter changchengzhani]TDG37108.1 hydrolase TatD [Pedobacter changchengzhani]